jgi:dihydroorotate dehydrogenase electron transfer subunit
MTHLLERPREISKNHYLLRIRHNGQNPIPGQFINIRTAAGTDPLIRRPISIFDSNGDVMDIIVQMVGPGTRLLCKIEPGPMDILGPLGKGFTLRENSRILIIGGGVGNAPLFHLSRQLRGKNNHITYIYGSRSEDFIYLEEKYRDAADDFYLGTDDGSRGEKGFTTDIAGRLMKHGAFDCVYTCGPAPMMSRISAMTPEGTGIEVSVENYFGCGIGLCVGCTVETLSGFRRACIDGPVMDGRTLIWNSMPH